MKALLCGGSSDGKLRSGHVGDRGGRGGKLKFCGGGRFTSDSERQVGKS